MTYCKESKKKVTINGERRTRVIHQKRMRQYGNLSEIIRYLLLYDEEKVSGVFLCYLVSPILGFDNIFGPDPCPGSER